MAEVHFSAISLRLLHGICCKSESNASLPALSPSHTGALSDNKGAIDLKEATSLNGPGQCNWVKEDNAPKEATPLLRIEILTSLRTFKMFATDSQAAAIWAEKLEMVRARGTRGPERMAKTFANVVLCSSRPPLCVFARFVNMPRATPT